MEKTKLKVVALVAAAVVVVGGVSFYAVNRNDNNKVENKLTTSQQAPPPAKLTVSEDKKTVSYAGQTSKTALEILKSLTTVSTKQSDFGEFVTGIDGTEADGNKEYWAFYVNGTLASEGAGTYKTTDGEKIEWRLEAL